MRILIVEDQIDVLDCLRSYAQAQGNQVLTASTAPEALACLDHGVPDVALIDLMLPQGNGRQVIEEISKRKLPTRVVVITACDDLQLRRELLSYGIASYDYLFKPVTIRDLDALMVPGAKSP